MLSQSKNYILCQFIVRVLLVSNMPVIPAAYGRVVGV